MTFFKILTRETQEQSEKWENYIRIRAADYYLHHFSPNSFAKIFGNGQSTKNSDYDVFTQKLEKRYGYFTGDIGYLGIYVMYGFFSIVALLIIFFRITKTTVLEEYLYVKYFLYFSFIVSIIIPTFTSPDYIPSIVFAIYILTKKDVQGSNYIETD